MSTVIYVDFANTKRLVRSDISQAKASLALSVMQMEQIAETLEEAEQRFEDLLKQFPDGGVL